MGWISIPPGEPGCSPRPGSRRSACRSAPAEDGEILARSNHVFAGYWEQPDESAKALADGWFHTGDEGRIEDGGYLVISDRKKDVIISGGENVSSVEVEDCLYQHPAVAEVAVIGVPSERWGETVKALVVLRAGQAADEAELIGFCRDRLAHFKCPTSVEFRDSPGPHRDRQAPEVQAAQPVLGGLREAGQLSADAPLTARGGRLPRPCRVRRTRSKRGCRSRPSGVHSVNSPRRPSPGGPSGSL